MKDETELKNYSFKIERCVSYNARNRQEALEMLLKDGYEYDDIIEGAE